MINSFDRFNFRVFDKNKNKMYYDTLQLDFEYVLNNKDLILMQSIGLKDKNEMLIYEGDICNVIVLDGDKIVKYLIDWSEDNAGFCLRYCEPNNPDYDIYGEFYDLDCIEIIGNIYENKELFNV